MVQGGETGRPPAVQVAGARPAGGWVAPRPTAGMGIFCTLFEAQVLVGCQRKHYSTVRPHSSPDHLSGEDEPDLLRNRLRGE